MKKFVKKNQTILIMAAIVLLGTALRFHTTPERYGFDYDATRDALIAFHGAQAFQLPLHGPPSAVGPFHFGPWYYYQLILFQLLVPLQYAPWISVTLLSILAIYFMYKAGEVLGGLRLGFVLALLTAVSPAQIVAGTGLSNPDMVFVCVAFVLWIFIKALKSKISLWWSLWSGLILGIGINYHYQAATMLLLPVVLFIVQPYRRFQFLLTTALGVAVAFLPLLVFNALNNWQTVSGLLFYSLEGRKAVYIPNSWTIYLRDFWPSFWSSTLGIPVPVGIALGAGCLLILTWLYLKKKLDREMIILMLVFAVQFIYLRYYSGSRESYYLMYLQPFIFLIVGYSLYKLNQLKFGMLLSGIILLGLLVLILPKSIAAGHVMESHVHYQQDVSKLIQISGGKKIMVYDCGRRDRHRSQAYAYLLQYEQKLGSEGIAIGSYDESCYDPEKQTVIEASGKIPVSSMSAVSVKNTIDLTNATHEERLQAGWILITPESVYDRELRP